MQLNPSNVAARRDLEDYDLQAPWVVGGNKDQAREQVEAIAKLDPVEGHVAHAIYDLDAQKKADMAEKEYREVLAAKPSKIEPYMEVIAFFQKQNKPADMQAAIQLPHRSVRTIRAWDIRAEWRWCFPIRTSQMLKKI